MAGVSFRGVTKRYGEVEALSALDLEIASGEFVSLLGPSGSGKTTTLNLLAGLADADAGEIRIGERVVNDLGPDERDIALVFQNYALYPHMTVAENLAFPLRARRRRVPEAEAETRIARVAGMLGVGDLLHRYPRELSGGQQQRVALGRAMIRDPQVFLLDEPLSNLDARLRIRMRHDIRALHEQIGSTIVYVTHDQAEAMTLSSRIAVFDRGRLQQFASPPEIYGRPSNMFVAGFVGEREINFVEGVAAIADGRLRLGRDGVALEMPTTTRLAPLAGRRVVLGARPEAIRPDPDPAAPGTPAVVAQTELSGPDLIVYARLADGAEICCRAEPATRLAKGAAVRLAVDPARAMAFDPATRLAIPLADPEER